MPVHQHFSVPAGDDVELVFDIDLNDEITLTSALVLFHVYEQQYGVVADSAVVLARHSDSGNGGVTIPGSPSNRVIVSLTKEETLNFLRNYYFELKVVDVDGNNSTVADGIITFLQTAIPPVETA